MNKIIKENGKVYLVENCEKKGFETFIYMGKDPDLLKEKKRIKKEEEI